MMARREAEEEFEDEFEEDEFEEDYEEGSWVNAIAGASWRRAVAMPLILVCFAFGTWTLWKKYRDTVLSHPSYQLGADKISYSEPPDWLQKDILQEVLKIASLDTKRSHESDLSVQVAGAFEHHPWVKRVERVRVHHPAKLNVELTYRHPIAMVVLPDDNPDDNEAYIQPIDAEAIWLPPEDFTPEFAQSFIRIDVGNTAPVGPVGSAWGDEMVADAAKIAELFQEDWDQFKPVLYQIERSSQSTSTSLAADFDIRGRNETGPVPPGMLIHWGRAPGKEQAGEPTAKAKLEYLKEWISSQHPNPLDLRTVRAMQAAKPGSMRR